MRIPKPGTLSRGRSGFAVLVLMVLLALLLLMVAANARTLHYLGRQIHLIEEKQQQRWAGARGPLDGSVRQTMSTMGYANGPPHDQVTAGAAGSAAHRAGVFPPGD